MHESLCYRACFFCLHIGAEIKLLAFTLLVINVLRYALRNEPPNCVPDGEQIKVTV
jgi:hypothetical protein